LRAFTSLEVRAKIQNEAPIEKEIGQKKSPSASKAGGPPACEYFDPRQKLDMPVEAFSMN